MFDPKSDYALNKMAPDAIVYKDAAGEVTRLYKDVIFDTSPVAGKVYKNSENRRKQGVSCGFR